MCRAYLLLLLLLLLLMGEHMERHWGYGKTDFQLLLLLQSNVV